jgi:photosystem II stability/assembly factor-like uncharacterized protein
VRRKIPTFLVRRPHRGAAARLTGTRLRVRLVAAIVFAFVIAAGAVALLSIAHAATTVEDRDEAGWGPVRPWDSLYSVTVLPSGKWLSVGAEGVLLMSTDGGKKWSRRRLAKRGDLSWYDLFSIRFAGDGKTGYIGGEHGIVLKTDDAGESWTEQKTGTQELIFRVVPVDAQHAAAAGSNGLLMWTDDGGQNWHSQTFKNGITFFDVAFTDPRNGWAVGEFATIAHTADGGKTWQLQAGGDRSKFRLPAYMTAIFKDAQHGWAAGQGGVIVGTDDGGANWKPVTSSTDLALYASLVPGTSGDTLWVAGDEGVLIRMSTTGAAAPVVSRPTFSSLTEVAFAGEVGITVGTDGTLLRSEDGGKTWHAMESK